VPGTSRTLAVATAATALITMTATATSAAPSATAALTNAVTANGIMNHLAELQKISDNNGGTRASGTPGFTQSMDYIEGLLKGAGYITSRQSFTFNAFDELAPSVFERVSPTARSYVDGEDFYTAEYSGSGNVTAPIQAVDVVMPPGATASSSNSGCETTDFAGFTRGNIALVQRGTCDFVVKAENAENAGAAGVIIYNEGTPGAPDRNDTLNPTLGDAADVAIPVVGTSFAIGQELFTLLQSGPVSVHLQTTVRIRTNVPTQNLVADSPTGRRNQTVMAGAHLDSVPEGAGIEDNGTGSATLLEIALQLKKTGTAPRDNIRFAWWGAEEAGLVGSTRYVASLTSSQLSDIDLYLNFDMIASPNYGRFIYDGDGSGFGLKGPNGSEMIEGVFEQYFRSAGLASEPTAFDGRSDYDAFIDRGIPAGGLFTGAEDPKSAAQVRLYGGLSTFDGEPVWFDSCYHQACDSLDPIGDGANARLYRALNRAYGGALTYQGVITNINQKALGEMSDAAAHAVLTFALQDASVKNNGNGTANAAADGTALGHHDKR
jgi:Zn-dependent M28 family amino/carboxypeptidase